MATVATATASTSSRAWRAGRRGGGGYPGLAFAAAVLAWVAMAAMALRRAESGGLDQGSACQADPETPAFAKVAHGSAHPVCFATLAAEEAELGRIGSRKLGGRERAATQWPTTPIPFASAPPSSGVARHRLRLATPFTPSLVSDASPAISALAAALVLRHPTAAVMPGQARVGAR